MRTICLKIVCFKDREKIKAKVNAFMFPDGEIDQNFRKGGT